jgi:hypothetical protein
MKAQTAKNLKFAEMAFDFVRISLYTDTARTAKK